MNGYVALRAGATPPSLPYTRPPGPAYRPRAAPLLLALYTDLDMLPSWSPGAEAGPAQYINVRSRVSQEVSGARWSWRGGGEEGLPGGVRTSPGRGEEGLPGRVRRVSQVG